MQRSPERSQPFTQATGQLTGEIEGILQALHIAEEDRWKLGFLVEELLARKDVLEERCDNLVERAEAVEKSMETEILVLKAENTALHAALAAKDRQLAEANARLMDGTASLFRKELSADDSRLSGTSTAQQDQVSSNRLVDEQQRQLEVMNQQLTATRSSLQTAQSKIAMQERMLQDLTQLVESRGPASESYALGASQESMRHSVGINSESPPPWRPTPEEPAQHEPEAAVSEDQIPVLLQSIRDNPTDVDVITHACEALAHLGASPEDAANRARVGKLGGVELIVEALNRFSQSMHCSRHAVQLLGVLAVAAANRQKIGKAGGIEAVANVMRGHVRDPKLMRFGCHAMALFAQNSQSNRAEIMRVGGVECVASAMREHNENREVQVVACSALVKLVLTPEETGKLNEVKKMQFEDGAYIIRQGEEGKHFFIIADGTAKVTKETNGVQRFVMELQRGAYFGEVALLRDEPRAANVMAVGVVKCLCIEREDFKRLLGERAPISSSGSLRFRGAAQAVMTSNRLMGATASHPGI